MSDETNTRLTSLEAGILQLCREFGAPQTRRVLAAMREAAVPQPPVDAVRVAVLAERERCAKVCERLMMDHGGFGSPSYLTGLVDGALGCANAIRKDPPT